MSTFASTLKSARKELGHRTARSFYEWLKSKGVSFNYSYYMRLEQGALPSEKIVSELASVLKESWGERLILAFCVGLFPKHSYLFQPQKADSPGPERSEQPLSVPPGQRELTPRQVAAIASSEACYQIFLLSTLSRRPMEEEGLVRWFSKRTLQAVKKELVSAGLIRDTDGVIEATAVEAKFPEAFNAEIKEAYEKFDRWDERFGEHFGLEYFVNKMMIRRVSGRYLSIIRKQLETLFELVKTSDELDSRYNESVLQLKVVVRQGKLPG